MGQHVFVNRQIQLYLVPQIRIKARRFLLVYIPFKDAHHELIQTELNLAVNKNMLTHAKNL